jgi:hypothetical protein
VTLSTQFAALPFERERAKERRIMADTRGGTVGFNDGDGCPVPCPGGTARRSLTSYPFFIVLITKSYFAI